MQQLVSPRVAYSLAEILLPAVCGTIADCDDYDDIADWGEHHLGLRWAGCRFTTETGRRPLPEGY